MDAINPSLDTMEATSSHLGPSYPVDFIMNVELQTSTGTDIPLYNKTLEVDKEYLDPLKSDLYYLFPERYPEIKRCEGDRSDVFDSEKEDYWLFYVHLKYAELEIAIGGEEPIYVTSRANWNTITDKDEDIHEVKNWANKEFELSWKYGDSYDRFVAVRAPKMDNPAISLRTHGQYGAVHWVGLFTKTGVKNTNHFIAIRTSNRLLPDYAERTKKYPSYRNYQFVTQDPYNKVGIKHFEHALAKNKGQSPWPKRYMWGAEGTTYVCISRKFFDLQPKWFHYVSGVMLKDKVTNKGWELLLELFGGTVQILKGVLSVSVADVVQGAISLGDAFNEEKMHQEANLKGFLTVIGDAVDIGNKARKNGKEKKTEKPNVTNILILVQHIEAGTYSPRDLGSRPREIE
ncbi:hypothetical protein FSHL1_002974 [Fusarium sambucinum]